MIRLFFFLILVALLAIGAAWLADRPGEVVLEWQGWQVETSVVVLIGAVIILVLLLIAISSLIRLILAGPAHLSGYFRARRRDRGYRALSRGMIAAAAGDQRNARRHAGEARGLIRGEPLTLLLEAQAAQLAGERATARRAFEAMLANPETELLGLRGLYLEAQRSGDGAAARTYAERAAKRAPGLGWAGGALLEFQTRDGDWDAALETVSRNADARLIDRNQAKRSRAVLLTAKAQEIEDQEHDTALALALDAHNLAPELVPAAVIAGRLSAAAGNTRQATRILEKTWKLSPHPDIAEVYSHARPGDSARDRLKRARTLAQKLPAEPEGRMAVAIAAIEARDWKTARAALTPLLHAPSQRVCLLMAEIEEGQHGDVGRSREWLSRAVRAPRDPAWTADGYVSRQWLPVSPVTGRLDAFEWKLPLEAIAAEPPEEEELPPTADLELEPARQEPAAPSGAVQRAVVERPAATKERAPESLPPKPLQPPQREHRPAQTERTNVPERARPSSEEVSDLPRPPDDPGPEPEHTEAEPARRLL